MLFFNKKDINICTKKKIIVFLEKYFRIKGYLIANLQSEKVFFKIVCY
jgi:hypothetical protein